MKFQNVHFFQFMSPLCNILSVQACINNKRQLIKSIRMDFVHQSIHMVLELELSRITWIFRKIDLLLLALWSYFTHGRSIHKFKANLNHSNISLTLSDVREKVLTSCTKISSFNHLGHLIYIGGPTHLVLNIASCSCWCSIMKGIPNNAMHQF